VPVLTLRTFPLTVGKPPGSYAEGMTQPHLRLAVGGRKKGERRILKWDLWLVGRKRDKGAAAVNWRPQRTKKRTQREIWKRLHWLFEMVLWHTADCTRLVWIESGTPSLAHSAQRSKCQCPGAGRTCGRRMSSKCSQSSKTSSKAVLTVGK